MDRNTVQSSGPQAAGTPLPSSPSPCPASDAVSTEVFSVRVCDGVVVRGLDSEAMCPPELVVKSSWCPLALYRRSHGRDSQRCGLAGGLGSIQ